MIQHILPLLCLYPLWSVAPAPPAELFSEAQAEQVALLALSCLEREYPNKLDHVMGSAADVQPPSVLHPAFFGCLDWHSAVHGHCLLVQMLKRFPQSALGPRIRALLGRRLTPEHISGEVAYLGRGDSRSFERPYGWAWLLKLAQELKNWDDEDARTWDRALEPLTQAIVARFLDFFPRQEFPIRTGVHPNTAFALALAWDFAATTGHTPLRELCEERARAYFLGDRNAPASWEPGGEDFLSPTLMEADLMRRVLPPPSFRTWWQHFLPPGKQDHLLMAVRVSDRTDPKIAHLDGLNLSRAWCLAGLSTVCPQREGKTLRRAAQVLLKQTLPHLNPDQYEGSHWLGTFALNALIALEDASRLADSGN